MLCDGCVFVCLCVSGAPTLTQRGRFTADIVTSCDWLRDVITVGAEKKLLSGFLNSVDIILPLPRTKPSLGLNWQNFCFFYHSHYLEPGAELLIISWATRIPRKSRGKQGLGGKTNKKPSCGRGWPRDAPHINLTKQDQDLFVFTLYLNYLEHFIRMHLSKTGRNLVCNFIIEFFYRWLLYEGAPGTMGLFPG